LLLFSLGRRPDVLSWENEITFALFGAADRVCLLPRCRRDISGLDINAIPSPAM
jgi:hypothetical protein